MTKQRTISGKTLRHYVGLSTEGNEYLFSRRQEQDILSGCRKSFGYAEKIVGTDQNDRIVLERITDQVEIDRLSRLCCGLP